MKAQFVVSATAILLLAPISQAAKPAFNLTGEYDYKQGANQSTLYVKELPGGAKIQFAVQSLWVGNAATGNVHTGQAGGVATVKKDVAVFENKADHLKLTFRFSAGKCKVECPDESINYFGGANVDPNGLYKKVNSKMPSEKDLSVDN